MGFTTDEDGGGNGRMPDLVAELVDIGVDYRQYDDGNEENRLVVIWKPDNDVFGRQTSILSMSNLVSVKPAPRVIRVGGEENGFNIEIIGDVISKGKLGYKASAWMGKVEKLGVKTPGDSGDLKELIGVRAVISEMTYNESKGNDPKSAEKPFWMPIEIRPTVKKEEPVKELPKKMQALEEVLPGAALGKSEKELVAWYEESGYYNGVSAVPLFKAIAMFRDAGILEVQNGIFIARGKKTAPAAAAAPMGYAGPLGAVHADEDFDSELLDPGDEIQDDLSKAIKPKQARGTIQK
jgi:hypothetical protein